MPGDNGKSSDVDVTLNGCESLNENFVNNRLDDDDEESEWVGEDEVDFERSAFDTFIIDDE